MIAVTTNITAVIGSLSEKVLRITTDERLDALERTVAGFLLGAVKERIHNKGLNTAGTDIGTYSRSYLKRRQKPPFNRTDSPRVILSLNRDMERDFKTIATSTGWGLGFDHDINFDKSQWVQEGAVSHNVTQYERKVKTKDGVKNVLVTSHFNKGWRGYGDVYKLTEEEKRQVKIVSEDFINNMI